MNEYQEKVKNGICPYCGSSNLDTHQEPDGEDYTLEIFCHDCNKII